MQLRTRTWCLISLSCFLGAAYFWRLGNEYGARPVTPPSPDKSPASAPAVPVSPQVDKDPATKPADAALPPPAVAPGQTNAAQPAFLKYRVSNTTKTLDQLARSESAILLMNAQIDTSLPIDLKIPEHLRASGDAGAYVVQSRAMLNDAFRAQLREVGAEIVSYIPHNAYLVRVDAAGSAKLAGLPQTQSVIPWEPYYKLAPGLLELGSEQQDLPEATELGVLVYGNQRAAALQAFADLNAKVLAEQRSPFGTQFIIRPPLNSLVAIAQLPVVQQIEPYYRRIPANDLMRPALSVTTNSTTAENYLNLTGRGVLVGVNDTGVDGNHPHLAPRVTSALASTFFDPDGHGTHVAGTIAGSAMVDGSDPQGERVPGSATNALYRGIAPEADIFALPIDLGLGVVVTDEYLQENSARTNVFISNNSWAYPVFEYTAAAALWDAAVRDALPEVSGSQPLLAVFPAGNSGNGNGSGLGSFPGRINAPGTAKNVITVGAIEQLRTLTNNIIVDGETNKEWLAGSDSFSEVASFSGRGNTGIGVESSFGRFKPDLVAPGSWVVSLRSDQWVDPDGLRSVIGTLQDEQIVAAGETNQYVRFMPRNGIRFTVQTQTNRFSNGPLPPLLIHVRQGDYPNSGDLLGTNSVTFDVTQGDWYFSIANTNKEDVYYDLVTYLVVTNNPGNRFIELKKLNDLLAPHFRFESGSSMAAAGVSGMLALMQENFVDRLGLTNASPALMKALLINGARSLSRQYDLIVDTPVNHQGWGIPNLTNSLPISLGGGPIQFYDQDPTNALATGHSHTRTVTLQTNAQNSALRVTLVWTDPPGNPSAGIKLVNDLDLIVTNLDSGEAFVGNNIPDLFNEGFPTNSNPSSTNNMTFSTDYINNVENVFLEPRLGLNYSITVVGKRVNVNAVTAHPDGVVQDYALVISQQTNTITALEQPPTVNPLPLVTTVTNGFPLLSQRVGANSPLLVSTNGVTNQWSFYVFANDGSAANTNSGQYVAFTTFLPPNLSRSRFTEADIDMYVSTDSNLTNLDATAMSGALRAVSRRGNESIILSNAESAIYYVGIKSEDQQAATFGFFAVSSSTPFSDEDSMGNIVARGYPLEGVEIPDGSPITPNAGLLFAFVPQELTIQNIVVTNIITHGEGGDLLGNLSHNQRAVILNNHRSFGGTVEYIWDDSDSGEIPVSEPTDGPDSLQSFVGDDGQGVWQLTMIDNAPGHTGRVESLSIALERQPPEALLTDSPLGISLLDFFLGNPNVGARRTILPGRWDTFAVDVPADATNLAVCVAPESGPVEVYIRRGSFPDRDTYDLTATVGPPGDCVNLGRFDSPPLSQGRYFVRLFNPNGFTLNVRLLMVVQRDLEARIATRFRSNEIIGLLDDATTNSFLFVTNHNTIADVSVGIRINHERASDLVVHVVSPDGTRLLLTENRGSTNTSGYGASSFLTNSISADSGGAAADTNVVDLTQSIGTVIIEYQFYGVPDRMIIYYDGAVIYDTGVISGSGTFQVDFGPGASTNLVIVMNPGNNSASGTLWEYSATIISGRHLYAVFTDNTNFTTVPIKFAPPPFVPAFISATNITYPISDFDLVGVGTYDTNSFPWDGWSVVQHQVDVSNSPTNFAHTPNNYLVLAGGRVGRTLPTQGGHNYRLSFAYRSSGIVGWWRGEQTVVNIISGETGFASGSLGGTNYYTRTNAFAGPAWVFDGFDDVIILTNDIPLTNSISIEAWICPTRFPNPPGGQIVFRGDNLPGRDPYYLSMLADGRIRFHVENNLGMFEDLESSTPLIIGRFTHVAATLDAGTGIIAIYIDGVLDAVNITSVRPTAILRKVGAQGGDGGVSFGNVVPLPTGTNQGFFGLIDEISIYDRALTQTEVTSIYSATNSGKCGALGCAPYAEVILDGVSTPVIGTSVWRTASIPFNPTSNTTSLVLAGNPVGMLFDTFNLIEEPGDVFYQPEEPLTPFRGQNAYGLWRLEVWDNRVGGVLTNSGELLSWELRLTFVNTNPPTINLTNGTCYSGVVEGSNTVYFVANVPLTATWATNTLAAENRMRLTFNTNGLPFTNVAGNIILLNNTTNGTAAVGVNSTVILSNGIVRPPPYPGARLPAGKRYYLGLRNIDGTQTNAFTLCLDYSQILPRPLNVIPLTNLVSFTNMIQPGPVLDYYDYIAASNSLALVFEILNPTEDADLYVRRGLPLPTPDNFFRRSIRGGTNNESIVIIDPSLSLEGPWYLGVQNFVSTKVMYEVRASEAVAVTLQDGISYTNRITSTNIIPLLWTNAVQYYRYNVSSNAFGADFSITNNTGDVNLYITPAIPPLPSPVNFFYASAQVGLANEFIRVTNTHPTRPLTPGDWWIAVVARTALPIDYEVRVVEDTNPPPSLMLLTNRIPETNIVSGFGVDYYAFNVSSNAVQVNFELLNLTNNFDLFIRPGLPLPGTNLFTYASTNVGAINEFVVVTTNSPVRLRQGNWYLAVVNRDPTPAQYTVLATEFVPGTTNLIVLTNGVSYVNAVVTKSFTEPGIDYYVFDVPTNAVEARFELFGASGDVNMFIRPGVPLPGPTNFAFSATALGSVNEDIRVLATSTPALTPGPWFIAVVNNELFPVFYNVRATAFAEGLNIVRLTNMVGFNAVTTPTLVPLQPSTDYYVFNVPANAVQATFETFGAGVNVDLYVTRDLPLPSTTNFMAGSANSGLTNEFILLTTNSLPVSLLPGDWYLAVVNRDAAAAPYTVRASAWGVGAGIVALTNGVVFSHCAPVVLDPLVPNVDYYEYVVSSNALQVLFETTSVGATNDMDIYLRRGVPLPTDLNFDYASTNAGTGNESILLLSNSVPVALAPGAWYLAVVSRNTNSPVCYSVRVLETAPSDIVTLTSGVPFTFVPPVEADPLARNIHYYRFVVATNAVEAYFETFDATGDVDLYIGQGTPLPGPGFAAFAGTSGGTTNELISLSTMMPATLQPGEWFLAVINKETFAVGYTVQATQYIPDQNITRLISGNEIQGVVGSPNGSYASDLRFYVFNVSAAAQRAQFEVNSATGDVSLYAKRFLSLPVPTNHEFASTNPGVSDELIAILPTSTPVGLTAGDWYISVHNVGGGADTYGIKATEFTAPAVPLVITNYTLTSNSLCLTWTSQAGVLYYVQGTTNLAVPVWESASPTITANSNLTTYCIPLPSPFTMFRVAEGVSPANASPVMNFSSSFQGPVGFTLLWMAPTNQQFMVQWSPVVQTNLWNTFSNVVTSTNGIFRFVDDGSQTMGRGPRRFYRLDLLP